MVAYIQSSCLYFSTFLITNNNLAVSLSHVVHRPIFTIVVLLEHLFFWQIKRSVKLFDYAVQQVFTSFLAIFGRWLLDIWTRDIFTTLFLFDQSSNWVVILRFSYHCLGLPNCLIQLQRVFEHVTLHIKFETRRDLLEEFIQLTLLRHCILYLFEVSADFFFQILW